MENGSQCPHNHHHLLHRSNSVQISIAMAASSAKAVLRVLSANIGNANGLFKHVNVLLDSGSQISLIKQETAESLGLKGKDASITITKLGGEEETLKTKEYTIKLTSIGDMSRNARNNKNGKKDNIMANLANMAKMTILPESPTWQSTKQ